MLKINENAEKRIIRISGARLVTQADPVCTFVVVCVAACLPGGPCLLQNWFWGGVAESWKPEALQKLPDVSFITFLGFSLGGE